MPKSDDWTGWRANVRVLFGYIAAIGFFGIGYNCQILYQHGFRSNHAFAGLWGAAALAIPVLVMRNRVVVVALGLFGLALPGLFNSIVHRSATGVLVCTAILVLGLGVLRLVLARDRDLEAQIARWGADQLTLRAGWWRPELPTDVRGWLGWCCRQFVSLGFFCLSLTALSATPGDCGQPGTGRRSRLEPGTAIITMAMKDRNVQVILHWPMRRRF